MHFFIYDIENNLSIGSVTKSKNGIIVKSRYDPSIKEHCLKWDDVNLITKDKKEMEDAKETSTHVFLTPPENLKEDIREKFLKTFQLYPDSSIYDKDSGIVVGKNMELNLKVCLFHGLSVLITRVPVQNHLDIYQKKLFKKIYIVI